MQVSIQDNKKNKIKGEYLKILGDMEEYTINTIEIIENNLETSEKEIFDKQLFESISIYSSPEEKSRIIWLTMTKILNEQFNDTKAGGKHQMLNTTFNSRSAEFDEFLKKLGFKKKIDLQ